MRFYQFRRRVFLLFALPFSLLLVSCIPQKRILYLQDAEKDANKQEFNTPYHVYKVKPGDELYIRILSLDEKTTKMFNSMVGEQSNTGNMQFGGAYLTSFTISDSGYIDFPYIGRVEVEDMTLDEVKNKLHTELSEYLKYITVVVKLVNFKVSVLGEVRNPGQIDVLNERITLFEALSLAGDLDEYGNRNNIALLRRTEEGTMIRYLDITQKDIMNSDYYYLMPDDVIYVSPMAAKAFNLRNFQLQTFLSLLSSTIVLFYYFNPN